MTRVMTLTVGSASTADIRLETLQGREYTVVPVIAIVEGVLQGANSTEPELAVASEFGKYPSSWDGRPVVLRHPQISGIFVSANHPQIFEDWQMGFMFGTKLDNDKLKTEAWLDNARIAELGGEFQETLDRINAGEVIDVSVGVFLDIRPHRGTFNGKQYSGQWENVVPDHLAILPDQVGACSVADGCGTNRVAQSRQATLAVLAAHPEIRLVEAPSCCDACARGESCMSNVTTESSPPPSDASTPTEPTVQETTSSETGSHTQGAENAQGQGKGQENAQEVQVQEDALSPEALVAVAEMHQEEINSIREIIVNSLGDQVELSDAVQLVRQSLPIALNVESWACDVMAMTADVVVFFAWGEPALRGFHQIKYSVSNDGQVTFTGDPEPVNLMTRILPRQTVDVNSGQPNSEEVGTMTEQTGQGGNQPAPAATTEEAPGSVAAPTTPAAPTVEAAPTLEEFLQNAPAPIREVLQESIGLRNQKKASLIASIKANQRNTFSDEQLNDFDLPQLEAMAALADIPTYEGRHIGDGDLSVNNGPQPAPFMGVNTDYLVNTPPAGNA